MPPIHRVNVWLRWTEAQVTGKVERVSEPFKEGLEMDSPPTYENSKALRNVGSLYYTVRKPPQNTIL
jgi:hypothetical protein